MRKKVTVRAGNLSVEQKTLLCGVTLNRIDIAKFGYKEHKLSRSRTNP